MKKGCLLVLVMFAALIAAYYFLLQGQFTHPNDKIAVGIAAFFSLMGISLLRNADLARKDMSAISASIEGEPPKDGKMAGAVGAMVALGEPILSPFSQTPCVAYGYEIYRMETTRTTSNGRSETRTSKHMFYSGFRLAPCAIQTRSARLRLLGFLPLDEFGLDAGDREKASANFHQYREGTQFEDLVGLQIRNTFRQFNEMLNDDDGEIRKDFCLSADGFTNDTIFHEEVLRAGEPVCIIGMYSAAKGGLISDIKKSGTGLRIFRGDGKVVLGKRRSSMIQLSIFGVILLAAVHGGLWFAIQRFGAQPQNFPIIF